MKALVSGAGIAGLSAALALSRKGWEVELVEKAPGLRTNGYMIDFFGPGYEAAERLGIIEALRAASHQVDEVEFVDAAGRHAARMDYRLARKAAGGKLFALLRGDIEQVLHDALPATVPIRYGTEIAAIDNGSDGVGATLSDGKRAEADLLVGAGGIHSVARRLLLGPEERFLRFLGHHTAAYLFEDETVRQELGTQFKLLGVPGRQAGFYDTGNGRLAAFFVHRTDDPRRPADPAAAIRAVYGDLGWVVPRALKAMPAGEDIYYDLVAQVVMERWSVGRIVLLGDAAYAVSLLAGQGASLAIAGAEALAAEVGEGDVEGGIARLEARLKPLIAEKQAAGRRTADWLVPPTRLRLWIRNAALNLVSWPPLVGFLAGFVSAGTKGFSPKAS